MTVEQIGNCTLIHGNCLEAMQDSSLQFDHVITDPPYEKHMHNAKAASRGKKAFGAQRRIRTDGHANPPPVDFASIDGIREPFTDAAVKACGGWFIAFCTPEGVAPWRDAIEAAGARYKRACFWIKPDSTPQLNGQGPAMAVEAFVTAWCGRGLSQWNGGGRRNYFEHMTNSKGRHGVHPTEKPVSLMMEIIMLFTDLGQIVFDPFAGSGTTGVTCALTGRHFVGIEQDKRYFDVMCERITKAHQQSDMFVHVPTAKKKSLDLFPKRALQR